MPLIDRIGIDIGIKHSVEDGLRWAATHGLRYVDFRLDTGPEAFDAFTPERWVVYLHTADKYHRLTRRPSQDQKGLEERPIMVSQQPSAPW